MYLRRHWRFFENMIFVIFVFFKWSWNQQQEKNRTGQSQDVNKSARQNLFSKGMQIKFFFAKLKEHVPIEFCPEDFAAFPALFVPPAHPQD